MGKKKESNVTVTVYGIAYPEFAKLKWQQFLRGFSLAVALLVLIVLALFGSRIRRDWVFRLAALGALAVSLLEVVRTYTGVELAFLDLLPLASLDFGWVLPAAVCGAVGALIPGGRTAAS